MVCLRIPMWRFNRLLIRLRDKLIFKIEQIGIFAYFIIMSNAKVHIILILKILLVLFSSIFNITLNEHSTIMILVTYIKHKIIIKYHIISIAENQKGLTLY